MSSLIVMLSLIPLYHYKFCLCVARIPTQVIEIPMKQANFEFNGDKYDNQMIFQVWYPKEDIRDPDADKKVRSQ